jgi:hypothetical protein
MEACMTPKIQQVVEKPIGQGEVFDGNTRLAKVGYALVVVQESLVLKSLSGDEIVPGIKDITGGITVVEGDKDLAMSEHGPLKLHLEDGRRWEFLITQGDPVAGTYQIVNASSEGLTQ